jgi:hypothetical protein
MNSHSSMKKTLLLAATLSMNSVALRVDESSDPADTFSSASLAIDQVNSLGPIEASTVADAVNAASDAKTASDTADKEFLEAKDAGATAWTHDLAAQTLAVTATMEAGQAQVAVNSALNAGSEAKVAMSKAHLEGVDAQAAKQLNEIGERTRNQEKVISDQVNHKCETIKAQAIEAINTGHTQAQARVKEFELAATRQEHESTSIASKSVKDFQESTKNETDSQIKVHAANAAKSIQEAESAAELRIKKSTETMNVDIKRIDDQTASQIESIGSKVTQTKSMVGQQINSNEMASNNHIAAIEAAARSTIARGNAQAEETIKDCDAKTELKVQEQTRLEEDKHTMAEKAIADINVAADARVREAQADAVRASTKSGTEAKSAIEGMLTKRAMQSKQALRAVQNEVFVEEKAASDANSSLAQGEARAQKADANFKTALDQFLNATEKAIPLEHAADLARMKEVEVITKAGRGTNDEAFPIRLIAAQGLQKAADYSKYAKFGGARAKSEMDKEMNPEQLSRITLDASMQTAPEVTPEVSY